MSLAEFRRGIVLFDEGRFYDAHEVLEDVWRGAQGEKKRFLQGLIQAAVALHHHSTGNTRGASSLLERSLKNLCADPGEFGEIPWQELKLALSRCREALSEGRQLPPLPRLQIMQD